MSFFEIVVLSTALGTDLFSVAVPIGMNNIKRKTILKSAFVFALFHIIMALIGYLLGHYFGSFIEHISTYHLDWRLVMVKSSATIIGALILLGIGVHMIKGNLLNQECNQATEEKLKGKALFFLAFGVSVDALAAGFGLGMIDINLLVLSLTLGAIIFCIAVIGLFLGRKVGKRLGAKAEGCGGLVLVVLSLHILWTALN